MATGCVDGFDALVDFSSLLLSPVGFHGLRFDALGPTLLPVWSAGGLEDVPEIRNVVWPASFGTGTGLRTLRPDFGFSGCGLHEAVTSWVSDVPSAPFCFGSSFVKVL